MTIGPCMRCDVCGRVEVDLTPVLDLVASPENREEFYAGWSMSIGEEVLDDDNGHWLFGEPPGQACDYCVDLLHLQTTTWEAANGGQACIVDGVKFRASSRTPTFKEIAIHAGRDDVTVIWQHDIEWVGDGDNRQISPMWVPIHPGDVAREVIGIGMFTTKTKAAA